MVNLDEESWGDVVLNKGFSGFFIVGEDISAMAIPHKSYVSPEITHHNITDDPPLGVLNFLHTL